MFAHFNHFVNSSDDDEPLAVTAEDPTSLDARHDAALLRDAVVKFSMKMMLGCQKGLPARSNLLDMMGGAHQTSR